MKVTKLGAPSPILNAGMGLNAGGRVPGGGNALTVLTSDGSNGRYWGENVRRITSNGSNILASPDVNIASGSNITFAIASNTLTIHGQAGGGLTLTANGSNSLTGAINLEAGTGIALVTAGQTIQIINTGQGGGGSGTHSYLGYNTAGASDEQTTANRVYAKAITPAGSGQLVSIGAYMRSRAGGSVKSFGVALYAEDSGEPGLLLASGSIAASFQGHLLSTSGSAGTHRWFHVPLAYYLTASVTYWIAVVHADATFDLAYDGSGSDHYQTLGGFWLIDWGLTADNTSTNKYSIRADFLG